MKLGDGHDYRTPIARSEGLWGLSARPDDTVYDAIKKMADENVGSLVVMEHGKLIEIITERHYSRNVFLKGRSSPQTKVTEIMERDVVCVRPKSVGGCVHGADER